MNLLPFQGLFPKNELIASTDSFFANTKFKFPEYYQNGFFRKDPQESMYIYQIESKKKKYNGIVCSIDIHDFVSGNVIPHEKTLAAKEQEQLSLLIERKAFIKPVLLAYENEKSLSDFVLEKVLENPDAEFYFEKNKETHRFWGIKDGQEIEFVRTIFKDKIQKVYVADGHHRCSTASLVWERRNDKSLDTKINSLLCNLIPFKALNICDYNRVVDITDKCSYTKLLASISKYCSIEILKKPFRPKRKFELSMFLNGEWYKIKWKKKVLKKYKDAKYILDHMILNDIVFNEILHIKDVKFDPSIAYIPGNGKFNTIIKKSEAAENGVGFMVYPVYTKELKYYADNQKSLPPKSTYFEPRMLNALIAQEIHDSQP